MRARLLSLLLVLLTLVAGACSSDTPTAADGDPAGTTPTDTTDPGDTTTPPEPTDTTGPTAPDESATATYVGLVDGTDAVFAIVPDPEDPTQVSAYVCNGTTLLQWGFGTVDGEQVAVAFEGGASLVAQLAGDGLTGSLTLPDGTSHDLDGHQASGAEGLYDITTGEQVTATREDGSTVDVDVSIEGEVAVATAQVDGVEVRAMVMRTEGGPLPEDTAEFDDCRLIVVEDDGQLVGSGASRRSPNTSSGSGGGGTGWTWYIE